MDSSVSGSEGLAGRASELVDDGRSVRVRALDHVAVRVVEREAVARFLVDSCGMHEIERTDRFTLVGGDAKRGKITLFEADVARPRGVLERIVVRVPRLADEPGTLCVGRKSIADEVVLLPEPSLPLGLVERTDCDVVDLDHVVLRVPEPETTAHVLEQLGFRRSEGRLAVADKHVFLVRGEPQAGEASVLDHLGLLVDSAADSKAAVEGLGHEVAEVVDATNTLAVFVWGPDRIKIEYVEHKPGFSLV
jgi:catechol 2,3-dioxygenase-like lactoylglutathione lyase family enzyme